jgi:hypothetical protein
LGEAFWVVLEPIKVGPGSGAGRPCTRHVPYLGIAVPEGEFDQIGCAETQSGLHGRDVAGGRCDVRGCAHPSWLQPPPLTGVPSGNDEA